MPGKMKTFIFTIAISILAIVLKTILNNTNYAFLYLSSLKIWEPKLGAVKPT